MKSYNKQFTINWVYLSILENTMSSLLSMALASRLSNTNVLASNFLIMYRVTWSVLVITIFLLYFWSAAHWNKTCHEQQNVSKRKVFLWTTLELPSWRTTSAPWHDFSNLTDRKTQTLNASSFTWLIQLALNYTDEILSDFPTGQSHPFSCLSVHFVLFPWPLC